LHKDEVQNFYSSQNIRVTKWRRMKCAGYVARMRENRNTYKILIWRPYGKR